VLVAVLSIDCIVLGWAAECVGPDAAAAGGGALRRALRFGAWVHFALLWVLYWVWVTRHTTGVPGFVWAIMCVLQLLEGAFGVVPYLARTPLEAEYAFCALSLGAKQSLAWMTIMGLRAIRES
jgi:hypothetical protein